MVRHSPRRYPTHPAPRSDPYAASFPRRRPLGKLALPVSEAQYYALLSRAYHGTTTREEMRWHISLTEGWSLIHAAGLLAGETYIWPDPKLSTSGRLLLRVNQLRQSPTPITLDL